MTSIWTELERKLALRCTVNVDYIAVASFV